MATLNMSGAMSTMFSARFLTQVSLALVGGMGAMVLTDWAQSNVVDISATGGDAVYPLIGILVSLAILPRRYGRPLALGMGVSAAETILDDLNVV